MKALEKDRNRRYETASALAADVQRYLADEPVQACPPSAWLSAAEVRPAEPAGRCAAGLALAVLLVLGTVGTSARPRVGAASGTHGRPGPRTT